MRFFWSIFLVLIFPLVASGQYSFTDNATGNLTITSVQSLTFTGGTAIPSFNTMQDYSNGVIKTAYLTLAVKSNVSWTIGVKAQSVMFTPQTQGGSTNMPASVLSLKSSTASNYFTISTSSQTLKTGSRGNTSASGNTFNVDMKFNPGFAYKGGIYTIGLMYTLSQQ